MALPAGVPVAKVADFGLALERGSTDAQLTATGSGLGTPAYVAPEQIDDSHVDMRADVYALGATVFHMLTGNEPYVHTSPMKVISQKAIGDESWRDELASDVSAGSRQLFLDLTASNADHRIPDYEEIIKRIDEVLPFASSTVPERTSSEFATEAVNSAAATRTFTRIKSKTKRLPFNFKWLALAACLLAAIPLLGYVGTLWLGSTTTPEMNEPLIDASNWRQEGLSTPLFNGKSVPRLPQSGFWQPTVAADGSRVLTGRAGSTLKLPIAVEGATKSRLRVSIHLKPQDKVAIEVLRDDATVEILRLDHRTAQTGNEDDTKSVELAQPANEEDVVFQRVELFRDSTNLAVFLNGKQLYEMPNDSSEVTVRSLEGQPEFADIDLGRMVRKTAP